MKLFLSIFFLFYSLFSYSQIAQGQTKVAKDERINWLVEQHRVINKEKGGIQGFRVQIYADSGSGSKLRTEKVKAEFEKEYPEIDMYLIYEEPYFKLRVGNFRTRLDARRYLEKISSKYNYAFIVNDKIEYPEFEID